MCEFISWIEMPNGKLAYLTAEDLASKRGRETAKHCWREEDLIGHGAIRYFFDLGDLRGRNLECTDFSKPGNFPREIAEAIKAGKFRGMGTPEGLLSAPALAEYDKVRAAAWAEYKKVCAPAWAEYKKVCSAAFWDLFANPKNRADAWK